MPLYNAPDVEDEVWYRGRWMLAGLCICAAADVLTALVTAMPRLEAALAQAPFMPVPALTAGLLAVSAFLARWWTALLPVLVVVLAGGPLWVARSEWYYRRLALKVWLGVLLALTAVVIVGAALPLLALLQET